MTIQRRELTSSKSLVILVDDEARVDSRVIAKRLGVEHENVMSLVDKNFNDFSDFGFFRFENGETGERGRPKRWIMFNEDQCYFLLTLVRNSVKAVPLKKSLVIEFGKLRKSQVGVQVKERVFTRPFFPTWWNDELGFEQVNQAEDIHCKRNRVGFDQTIKITCGLRNPVFIRNLTNLVFRIFTGFEVKDFRRGWGIPKGSKVRTRLFVDSNLRRAIDLVEAHAMHIIQQNNITEFADIFDVVGDLANAQMMNCRANRIQLFRSVPVNLRLVSTHL